MEGEKASTALQELEREAAFDAIIPSPVRYNDELRPNAKLLYGEIRALCTTRGYCWASNDYFAKRYKMNERSIARFIAQLEEQKYIRVVILRDENGRVCGRRIYIVFPLEVDENDTLNHMTKKSATCPKSQGEGDQKVSQSLNNNINNINTRARKKCYDPDVVKDDFRRWVQTLGLQEKEAAELTECLCDFVEFRASKRDPIASPTGVKYQTRELVKLSDGNPAAMIAMITKSLANGWKGIFRLRPDELQRAISTGAVEVGSGEEDTPWV